MLTSIVSRWIGAFGAAVRELTDPYRPELHYMRGPGPKWHARHRG